MMHNSDDRFDWMGSRYFRDHGRRFAWTLAQTRGRLLLPWFDSGAGENCFREQLEKSLDLHACRCDVDVDRERLPFADNSFQSVTCFEVVEHVLNPLFVLSDLWRVLRPCGRLFLSTPSKDSLIYKVKHCLGHIQDGHFHEYRVHELRQLLEAAGFHGITITPFRQAVHGTFARFDKQWLWVEAIK